MSFVASTNKVAAIRLCRSTLGGGARKVVVPSAAVMPVAASSSSASSAGASAALWAQGRSTPKGTIRALAARPIPRRQVIIGGGVAGLATTAVMGSGGYAVNAAVNAAAAAVEAPVNAAMLRPAVAAISALKVGMKLADGKFEVMSVEEVPEYNVACVELLHLKTGARWMHCGADDPNNVFNVAFRTTPTDSSGVAHILEHTALCGSERYPIRDPFFNMLRRSLSTFMNAMTSADYTCYPFATMNPQDYTNLLGVYLDAAFFPKLSREDFLQEGHRLEFAKLDDPTSDLMIKGVVFNEMKGAMGSQSARFGRALGAQLFPTSTYHHNSGGDPVNIPDLTHEQLKGFHALHYHPSNARFFTYGDLPLEDTLLKSEELALSRFEQIDVSSLEVKDEVRLTAPNRVEVTVPAEAVVPDANKQSVVSVAYLMVNQIKDPLAELDNFALTVASDLLLSGPQAYFHESLLESGLGSGFAPGTGYSGSRRETSFAVGLKGVADADVDEVEKRIADTLAKIGVEGFPRERVEAVMHQVELSAARTTTSFGLGVAFGAMGTWVHGGDGLRSLRTPMLAAKLNAALDADPTFWQQLVKRRFLDNPHRVTVVGKADKEYDNKLDELEKHHVAAISAALDEDAKATIVKDAVALLASQDRKQDTSVLPTLIVAEAVPREIKRWGSQQGSTANGTPLQLDEQPTNGITYASVLMDVSTLPDRLVPYLDLFSDFITELGTAKRDYKDLAQFEKLTTGGIGAGISTAETLDGTGAPQVYLTLSATALDRNVPTMFDLMSEVVTSAKWAGEPARLGLLLSRRAASAGASLGPQGLSYAKGYANAAILATSDLDYRTGGFPHVAMLQRLAREKEAAVLEVQVALSEIAAHVLSAPKVMRCRIACQPGASSEVARKELDSFLGSLPTSSPASGDAATIASTLAAFTPKTSKAFIAVPLQTNYCAASYTTVPYTHEDSASLFLLGQAMSASFLHREIREKGGAYGGGASSSPVDGVFGFSSYRDPNTTATIDTFRRAVEWAATDGNLTPALLEEAHLKAFKMIDAPLAPQSRGSSLFSSGLTDDARQTFRNQLLDCTADKMRLAAEKYLIGKTPACAIVGGPAAVEAVRAAGWECLDAEGNPYKAKEA
eukprot:CAMPEP_0197588272 /NCGR_PEP_ID=MMETSP1326-20131121/9609_1 /TAXON_ID=1155430 /ORGANISM="Genus nov. species nov., Strain RCC2288" /LENGTH=1128 /DNA_ID=CAMNT_0043153083 /DNA_START=236 /DNA_END=3622 /DNA_ORIENTATION=-